MKNMTLKIDEAVYDRARVVAARRKTSISGLVREYLNSLVDTEERREARRVAALEELYRMADKRAVPASDKTFQPFSRDDVYSERLR